MKLTVEEKLEKAMDFIKSVENMSFTTTTADDIADSIDCYCEECGQQYDVDVDNPNAEYVEARYIEELKDKAWHVLIDLI